MTARRFAAPIPILRMFDQAEARDFYVGYLGFSVAWEHRFEPHLPLYMQLQLGDAVIHLSEHHGDATPGSAIRIACNDVDGYCAELRAKGYAWVRPEPQDQPWGSREMDVKDPFGNRLTFYTPGSPPPA